MYLEEYDGPLEDVEALGVDYIPPPPCGIRGCDCHLVYVYAVILWVGRAPYLLTRGRSALEAVTYAEKFREEHDKEWLWKIRLPHGVCHTLDVETASKSCMQRNGTHHREDYINTGRE